MAMPSLRQLRYFLALVDSEHFGRAAEACNVSASAFSVAIKDLEHVLGVQLVDRTNRQVTITGDGQDVAVQARLCLRDVEALMDMTRRRQSPLAGPLRIGVIPTIAPFLLPAVLPALRQEFPDLQPFLREDRTDSLHRRLMEGELDVLVLALPFELRNTEVLPLFRDRFCLACRSGTSLVNPENFRLNRLNADSVLLLEDGHCLREHAISACKIRNVEAVNRFAASSLLTLIEMVDADLGVTFLPEMSVGSALLGNTRVRTYPLADNSYREVALAWRKGSGRAREFRMLGEVLSANAPAPA